MDRKEPLPCAQSAKRRTLSWRLPATVVLAFVALVALPHQLFSSRLLWRAEAVAGDGLDELTWADITPSRTLQWHKCYNAQYDCARLDVPMDWLDPTDDARVVLAVIRLPAVDKDDYRGPIFFNPGGPGGSGIWALKDHGSHLQTVVGKNHDIITFDPRGIGASVPRIECWDSVQKQHFWDLQEVGVVDAHPGVLYDAYARAGAYSQLCETALNSTGILQHSSTASHARDMLEILNQLGEDKLKYWGFSYGTILGGTFAAMYPDKIGRLVSDGNVDYREWYLKTHINFIRDADKVMDAFFDLCHKAGPDRCAFHSSNPTTIRKRLDDLLEQLRKHPVIVPTHDSGPEIPELVTYSKLKRFISTTLYRPYYFFESFAEIVSALEKGDGRPYYERMAKARPPFSTLCTAETVPPTVPLTGQFEGTDDAFPGIMCADSRAQIETVEDFERYAEELQSISYSAGATNLLFRLSCVARKIRPKWRFAGPFEGNTSFPILYVANIADNVTPLISARNNSAGFPSSVVLVQKSYGHTSLSTPSTCTARHIRAYFQNGTIPARDTECEPDAQPFGLPVSQDISDEELSQAIKELSRRASAAMITRP